MDNDTDERDFAAGGKNKAPSRASPRASAGRNDVHPQPAHQRLVFADPAAFRYLEEDPCTTVLERRRRLTGYELYAVEQWACSRVHPTFVITTYTGLEKDSVVVGILSVPTNEEEWSPRLRVYLKAIAKYHARKKETSLGALMVTNLSSFPSALTVIAVPDGDLKKHREDFIVNEDMKRMGCSGRAGMNLAPPTSATQAKFSQLYHTSDKIPLYNAVIELVKLCQVALMLFDKLAPEYADGLLCDVTEQAINDWWTEIGTEYFNIDPTDGILGPTTVSALLGMLMGARNRLKAAGAPVAKDVFDIVNTKRAIAHFQKSQKLARTRRLDQRTLERLHRVTAKAAGVEGWTVPRAVKSTMLELGGKGGQSVPGKETASIADVETLDIDTFIQLGSGGRFKWLWYGKERKDKDGDPFSHLGGDDGMIFNDSEQAGHGWSGKRRDSIDDDTSLRHVLSDRIYLSGTGTGSAESQASFEHFEKDQGLRRAVFKNMTGKVTDTRSGLGRIKDAVGRRGHRAHYSKPSKDGVPGPEGDKEAQPRASVESARESKTLATPQNESTPPDSGEQSLTGSKNTSRRGSGYTEDAAGPKDIQGPLMYGNHHLDDFNKSSSSLEAPAVTNPPPPDADYNTIINRADGVRPRLEGRETAVDPHSINPTEQDTEAMAKMQHFKGKYIHSHPLRTTHSLPNLRAEQNTHWNRRWPRQLSWTAMVDVVAASIPDPLSEDPAATLSTADPALALEKSLATEIRTTAQRLQHLATSIKPWVAERVRLVENFERQLGTDASRLDIIYQQKAHDVEALREGTEDLLAQEKGDLGEAVRELETLGGKLEYEIKALEGKVEDVEDGVGEFERQVEGVEMRVGGLDMERGRGRGSWVGWVLGGLLGWKGG
ncbi:hypothetical protein MMC21_000896 [Puttea exsequens]|nr:hypothetical protein [Puttea exsequens]